MAHERHRDFRGSIVDEHPVHTRVFLFVPSTHFDLTVLSAAPCPRPPLVAYFRIPKPFLIEPDRLVFGHRLVPSTFVHSTTLNTAPVPSPLVTRPNRLGPFSLILSTVVTATTSFTLALYSVFPCRFTRPFERSRPRNTRSLFSFHDNRPKLRTIQRIVAVFQLHWDCV